MGLTQPSTFTFIPGISLRVVSLHDNQPWFIAKDVCEALGLVTGRSVYSLDPSDVSMVKHAQYAGLPTRGMSVITEAGLYDLVLKSRKPEVKDFQRWITKEVLPSIRKDGGYVTQATAQAMIEDPEVMLSKALLFATNRLKVAEDTVVVLTAENLKLEVRGKGLEEDAVPEMTVKQFIRSRKIAATTGQRISLGHKATVLGEVAGRPKVKVASEFVGNDGERRQGVAGFYPIKALERAATAMGLKENSHA